MTLKLSILIVVYNCENYIAESIRSILNQSFDEFELIIVDGGSTDKTVQVIREFSDERIHVVEHKERFGLAESKNQGLHLAKGDLIAFQDADDISHRLRIEKQYAEFVLHDDLDVLGTSYARIDCKKGINQNIPVAKIVSFKDLLHGNQLCNGSVMLKKNIILKEGLYDPFFVQCEDYELFCRLAQKGYKIMNLQEPLYSLREHPSRLSTGKWKEQALYFTIVQDMYSGFFEKSKLEESMQKNPDYLYSVMSRQAKRNYHLFMSRKYVEHRDYLFGMQEFFRFVKLDATNFASLVGNKIH